MRSDQKDSNAVSLLNGNDSGKAFSRGTCPTLTCPTLPQVTCPSSASVKVGLAVVVAFAAFFTIIWANYGRANDLKEMHGISDDSARYHALEAHRAFLVKFIYAAAAVLGAFGLGAAAYASRNFFFGKARTTVLLPTEDEKKALELSGYQPKQQV